MIFADGEFPKLFRLDRSATKKYVLATYKTSPDQFVTYKNNKAISWASDEFWATGMHLMSLDKLNRNSFTIPQIDFNALIEKHKTIAFRNPREINSYFYNLDKTIYPTYDSIFELEQDIKKLPVDQIQSTLAYLKQILPLVTQFLLLLQKTDFDCKNRDRLNSMLEGIKHMLPGLIHKLQKRVRES